MGVLMQPVVMETEEGHVSYVSKESIERLKSEGFGIVHPLVGVKVQADLVTGNVQASIDTNDLMVLFLRTP